MVCIEKEIDQNKKDPERKEREDYVMLRICRYFAQSRKYTFYDQEADRINVLSIPQDRNFEQLIKFSQKKTKDELDIQQRFQRNSYPFEINNDNPEMGFLQNPDEIDNQNTSTQTLAEYEIMNYAINELNFTGSYANSLPKENQHHSQIGEIELTLD